MKKLQSHSPSRFSSNPNTFNYSLPSEQCSRQSLMMFRPNYTVYTSAVSPAAPSPSLVSLDSGNIADYRQQ